MAAVYGFVSARRLGGAAAETFVVIRLKEQEAATRNRLFFIAITVEKAHAAFVPLNSFEEVVNF